MKIVNEFHINAQGFFFCFFFLLFELDKLSEAEIIQKLALNQEWKWKQLTVETRIFIFPFPQSLEVEIYRFTDVKVASVLQSLQRMTFHITEMMISVNKFLIYTLWLWLNWSI